MKLRHLALAALAALSFNAHAGLTTYSTWDATYPGIAGVQFNVQTAPNGASVAMGAHPYIYGVTMPNDGVDTYYANAGLSNPLRANWSFDFAWDFGSACPGCSVQLFVDTDPGAGVNFVNLPITGIDSWNMEMSFMNAALGYDFDPFSASSTAFSLQMFDAEGRGLVQSDITVNVVPEPGSMALLGLGLAGMGALLRRRGRR